MLVQDTIMPVLPLTNDIDRDIVKDLLFAVMRRMYYWHMIIMYLCWYLNEYNIKIIWYS